MLKENQENRIVITREGRPIIITVRHDAPPAAKRIGVAEGQRLVADGWDDDDINEEVADLFLGDAWGSCSTLLANPASQGRASK